MNSDEIIKISDVEEIKHEVLKNAPGHIRLLLDPLFYATNAIWAIKDDLSRVKSPARRAKLESRLAEWEKTVQVLKEGADKSNT